MLWKLVSSVDPIVRALRMEPLLNLTEFLSRLLRALSSTFSGFDVSLALTLSRRFLPTQSKKSQIQNTKMKTQKTGPSMIIAIHSPHGRWL